MKTKTTYNKEPIKKAEAITPENIATESGPPTTSAGEKIFWRGIEIVGWNSPEDKSAGREAILMDGRTMMVKEEEIETR
jgi:hypothetical protein